MNREKWNNLSKEDKLCVLAHMMTIKKIILCEQKTKLGIEKA